MSDEIEGLLRAVNDLSKSQWTRTKALDDLIDLGAIKELCQIVDDKDKSDWVRKQALDGLAKNGASRELKAISDNPNIATWVRKTSEKLLSKMVKQPDKFFEVTISIDEGTQKMMEDISSNSGRSIPEVVKSFIEEGKTAQNLREEVNELKKEINVLKEEILSLQDLKEFNAKLRREKTMLHDQARKINVSLNTRSKEVGILNKAVNYTKEHADTLKGIINEIGYEFSNHLSCPKCGAEGILVTEYKISENKIEVTGGHCLSCLSK